MRSTVQPHQLVKAKSSEKIEKITYIESILYDSSDILKFIVNAPNKKESTVLRTELISMLVTLTQCSKSHAERTLTDYMTLHFGGDYLEKSLQEYNEVQTEVILPNYPTYNVVISGKYPFNSVENALLIESPKERNRRIYRHKIISPKDFSNFMDNVLNTTGFKSSTELRQLFNKNKSNSELCTKTFQRYLKAYINDDATNKNLKLKIEKSKSTKIGFYTIPNT